MHKNGEKKEQDLTQSLKRLSEIGEWFENQKEIDIEEGLKMVKEASSIIKSSRERLKAVENEFEEIRKEMDVEEEKE